ncbi:myosin-9-like [Ruditapes philippinarum]|uniref:myosin-9-like n=1 Tax=Ruditapes philippinarum TaxID=129788 RepID=UPI00295BCE84|nr:myosin-9-like [Ruditapes philippinarum]
MRSDVSPTKSNHSPSAARKANNEKEGEITKLQKEIERLKTELETERKTVKDKSHLLDDKEKQIKGLKKVIGEKDGKLKVAEEDAEHLSKRVNEENMKRTDVERHLNEKEELVMMHERRAHDNYVENQQLKARVKELESAHKTLAKEKNQVEHNAKKSIEHLEGYFKDEKRKYDDEYKKLLAERDDLRDRFSKLAGKKLQEQNADIADLSDPNRAMKLSEKFGQLYDDEWTNAFESLTDKKSGLPLKDAINVLLRLLQECWTFCNKLMATQMESLHSVFLHPAQNLANFDQKKTGLTDRPRITSKDQPSLNDLRKRVGVSPSVIEEVKQALLADSKTWDKREKKEFDKKHIEACTPYIQKCAEICWLMALHDPPLLMKMDVKQGEKFDTNIYTVYSQSGQSIDFLVWPPLYNGKDGGLLSKGVAEPIRVVSKKK